ncbi:hypothetical protein CLU79DRAFT_439617 [Phycomyces nitens]|nr:hypothetical protein CLU79DRAFT_439617 [Phycomyces nitens]
MRVFQTLDSFRPVLHGTKSNNNKTAAATIALEDEFDDFLNIGSKHHVQHELDWSPEETHVETSNHSSQTIHYRPGAAQFRQKASLIERGVREQRSGSMSSENSLNSQSTITTGLNQFTRYGPAVYPSESTSTSSRSHSRLSNYSASSQASSAASPILPRPSGMPTPSRSYTRKDADAHSSLPRPGSRMKSSLVPSGRSPSALPTRPSHIPAPKTSPTPEKTLSSKNSVLQQKQLKPQPHQSITMGRSDSRIAQRASHIPSVPSTPRSPIMSPVDSRRYSALSRPTSPMRANTAPRTIFSTPPSRITIVKPIPPTTGFKPPQRRHTQPQQPDEERTTGLSGLRPPSKSMSRIGLMKKPSNRP